MTIPRNLGAFADNLNSSGQASLTTGVSGTLPIANGGTGSTSTTFVNLTSNVTGTLPIANGGTGSTSTTFVNLASNVTGTLPIANGGTGSTSTTFVSLTTNVSGTLPIANGGTNSTATATAGGVGYGTGTAHAYTAVGTSGQVLTSAGAGTPTWTTPSAGAITLISTLTASGSASLSWTGLSGYDKYYLVFENLLPVTGSGYLAMRLGTGAGPTYATSGYYAAGTLSFSDTATVTGNVRQANTAYAAIASNYGNISASGEGASGFINIFNFSSATTNSAYFNSMTGALTNTPNYSAEFIAGFLTGNSTAKTAIQIYFTSGNIASGKVSLYGISS
jgi:hypothetical protein